MSAFYQSGYSRVEQWKALRALTFYRLTLSGLFLIIFYQVSPKVLGQNNPNLFQVVIISYLIFAFITGILARLKYYDFLIQAYAQIFIDIIVITLLMHASGGTQSGLGMLLIVAIAGGSLLITGKIAFLFAAFASIAVLSEVLYTHIKHNIPMTTYPQTGILGASFFFTAFLSHLLASRIHQSEKIATQRGIDLANLAQLNEHIIQHLQHGIIVIDAQTKIRMMNSSAWYSLDRPENYFDAPLFTICKNLDNQYLRWKDNPDLNTQPIHTNKSQTKYLPRFSTVSNTGTIIFIEDTSIIQHQIQQLKLASLGRLTASIAHEIRNPLNSINHASQLLSEAPHIAKEEIRLHEIIQNNCDRVNTIIENVLNLSRQNQSQPEKIELTQWLQSYTDEFINNFDLPDNTLQFSSHLTHCFAQIDLSQLHQIIDNLINNALTYGHSEHQPNVMILLEETSQQKIQINIIDFGKGIRNKDKQHLFEPFYTTSAKGSGLGLYISRQLCEMNRLTLNYQSGPTGGSCFQISIPVTSQTYH